jgi:5-methylcytosine-specific restriction endonuclease McrA
MLAGNEYGLPLDVPCPSAGGGVRLSIEKPRKAPAVPRDRRRKARLPKVRRSTVAALRRRLWALVAKYVRERDGNICVTCGKPGDQAGHFYSRRIPSLWIDPKNIGCQCSTCNLYMQGNPGSFADYIVTTYGPEELVRLTARAQYQKQWRAPELEMLIEAIQVSGFSFEAAYYENNL